jgi:hypothetical protein
MLTGRICSLVIVNECSSGMPKTSYDHWCYKGYVDALYQKSRGLHMPAQSIKVNIFGLSFFRFNKRRLNHHVRFAQFKQALTIYYGIMSPLAAQGGSRHGSLAGAGRRPAMQSPPPVPSAGEGSSSRQRQGGGGHRGNGG